MDSDKSSLGNLAKSVERIVTRAELSSQNPFHGATTGSRRMNTIVGQVLSGGPLSHEMEQTLSRQGGVLEREWAHSQGNFDARELTGPLHHSGLGDYSSGPVDETMPLTTDFQQSELCVRACRQELQQLDLLFRNAIHRTMDTFTLGQVRALGGTEAKNLFTTKVKEDLTKTFVRGETTWTKTKNDWFNSLVSQFLREMGDTIEEKESLCYRAAVLVDKGLQDCLDTMDFNWNGIATSSQEDRWTTKYIMKNYPNQAAQAELHLRGRQLEYVFWSKTYDYQCGLDSQPTR